MARGVNKVILIGNCGADPDTRYFPDGGAVTNVTVATSESWKDRQTGQMQDRTEWHRVVFRDRGNYRLGQIAGEYLRKGSKIYVEGSLRTRQWEQDGVKRYTTEIVASEMQMLDARGGQDDNSFAGQADYEHAAPQQQSSKPAFSSNQSSNHTPSPSMAPAPAGFDSFDDDIPF